MPKKQSPSKSSKRKHAASPARRAAPKSKSREPLKKQPPPAAQAATPKSTPVSPNPSPSPRPLIAKASLPAEAALSFLRDTKGALSWTLRDLSQTLNISREEAERVVALLEMQGYIQAESHKSGEWLTTPSGETVSGAKPPRFEVETVEAALTSLQQRILESNKDRAAKFQVTRAVAFGDFLAKDRARVQAADVGIELVRKEGERSAPDISVPHSAAEGREEQSFLRQLRGRSALLNLKPYSGWMGARTHQKLF